MEDAFSSVENMLRWQIDSAKRKVESYRVAFKDGCELYSLPKQSDGLPASWAFGKLTHHQVSLCQASDGLRFANGQIKLTETDLSKGHLPSAIYRIIQVNNIINSISASWTGAASTRIYRYVENYRKAKSIVAQKDRKKLPSKAELMASRDDYYAQNARYQGWKKKAQSEFDISAKTLNKIFNNSED